MKVRWRFRYLGKVSLWLALCRVVPVAMLGRFMKSESSLRARRGRRRFAWGARASVSSTLGFLMVGALVAGACAESGALSESGWGDGKGSDNESGDGDGSPGDGDGDGVLPPEVELEETFRAPVVAGEYLWSANPETNKVARINASTLEIEVLDGGHAPTYLAALPAGPTEGGALVLNELSQDASIYLLDADGEVRSHERLSVQRGASAWAVGPSGNFAIAWSDASQALLNAGDGYQDLTVFDFRGDDVVRQTLSVGFRPSKVTINSDETRGYVVSDPGISVIALEDDVRVLRELFLPETEAGTSRDVSFSKDGRFAFVRLEGEAELLVINTETNERVTVTLPGPVTDLDLSADGSLAVAVVRGGQMPADEGMGGAGSMGGASGTGGSSAPTAGSESHVALLDAGDIFDHPEDYELVSTSELVGSAVVAEDGSTVLLFTNAVASPYVSILDTESKELRVVDLKAPVRAAILSDEADFGVVLMNAPEGSASAGAFALLPVLDERPARIEGTETPPQFVSISSKTGRALVTTSTVGIKRANTYFARFPSLQLDDVELPSRPLSSGIVPDAGQAFVAQEHPEGRVTFLDLETGEDQTVTGFELSSRVVQR